MTRLRKAHLTTQSGPLLANIEVTFIYRFYCTCMLGGGTKMSIYRSTGKSNADCTDYYNCNVPYRYKGCSSFP